MKIRLATCSVPLKLLHDWRRGHFKKLKKSAFQAIFLQNCKNFNTPLYPWQGKHLEKRISHCYDTFSSIRLTCYHKIKHAGVICNDVDHVIKWRWSDKKDDFRVSKNQWQLLPLRSKVRHSSFHKPIRRSLEILNLCMVLKNHEPVHVKHGKFIFVPEGEFSRMRTTNLNLMMQKGCLVVQMIIAHKGFHIIYISNRWHQKIKLRWQWNSV